MTASLSTSLQPVGAKSCYPALHTCPLRFPGRRYANPLQGSRLSLAALVAFLQTSQCEDTCGSWMTFARNCTRDHAKGDCEHCIFGNVYSCMKSPRAVSILKNRKPGRNKVTDGLSLFLCRPGTKSVTFWLAGQGRRPFAWAAPRRCCRARQACGLPRDRARRPVSARSKQKWRPQF